MKAFILAAGIGRRLQPLTDSIPKALVTVAGKPMVLHLIERLSGQGIREFVVNLHHHADMLQEFLSKIKIPGISIAFSDERDRLLDTGGAVKRAAHFFREDPCFLIHNVDVWSDLDVQDMVMQHLKTGALATLAVRERTTSRYLLFNHDNQLCGWENTRSGEQILISTDPQSLKRLAFSGVQVMSPGMFNYFPPEDRFSMVDLFLAAAPYVGVLGYLHNDGVWSDLGSPGAIKAIRKPE